MTTDQQIERLALVVNTLAASAAARGGRIEGLIEAAERHDAQLEVLMKLTEENRSAREAIERQWLAYIASLPRQ